MKCLRDAFIWLFGISWNRSEAKAKMERLIKVEEDNAGFLSDLAYQNAMKRLSEVSDEDRIQATQIADELLVRLASIEMTKNASVKIIKEEFAALDKKMSALSKNFISRWLGGRND